MFVQCFTYIFTAHRHRQVRQDWSRTDPQEKPAAQLHHVEVDDLLEDLLREIMKRNGIKGGSTLCLCHFVQSLTSRATFAVNINFLVGKRQTKAIDRKEAAPKAAQSIRQLRLN